MPLNNEQTEQIKEQLLSQIDKFPQEQRPRLKQYISSMNSKQLEEFLIKNKMIKQNIEPIKNTESKTKKSDKSCVFCAIAEKQIGSIILYEDKDYCIALEINPFTEGHAILIPKKHIKEAKSLPAKAFAIANRAGKQIAKKLKAKSFQITTTAEMNHAIINIIPLYKEPLTSERKKAGQKELQETAIKIGEIEKHEPPRKRLAKRSHEKFDDGIKMGILKFPRRIP